MKLSFSPRTKRLIYRLNCTVLSASALLGSQTAVAQSAALDAIRNNENKQREAADAESKRDPTSHFVVVAPGVVKDTRTGLEWMRCSLGQDWNDQAKTCEGSRRIYNGYRALEIAKKLNDVGGYANRKGWRVPTIKELKSLIYCSKGVAPNGKCVNGSSQPTIAESIFPNTPPEWYWSSTIDPNYSGQGWFAEFSYGGSKDDGIRADLDIAVRLVR